MKIYECVIYLFGGLGVFMTAMNLMSSSLQKAAGQKMKTMLSHITGNRFLGVIIGAVVTAIIQSSSATTVMIIGMVNADVMTLEQATAIIMGANIGTTITGVLVSLQSLHLSLYFGLLAFIGVMVMLVKNNFTKNVGGVIAGLGLIFIGLDHMSDAFDDDGIKTKFEEVFNKVDFPLLLLLIGLVFTCIIQSSSAMTGIIIVCVQNKVMSINSALYVVLGTNIGTCVTALISTVGTTSNAKRTGIIHLSFNVTGTILFLIFVWPLEKYVIKLLGYVTSQPAMQIAWFHVFFNIITTIILIGLIKYLVKFSKLLIKDDDKTQKGKLKNGEKGYYKKKAKFINKRFLATPQIALMQVGKEIESMLIMAKDNFQRCFDQLCTQDNSNEYIINKCEEVIYFLNIETTKYLIKLSPLIDEQSADEIARYFNYLNDIERIADHTKYLLEDETKMNDSGIKFSDDVISDLTKIVNIINSIYDISLNVFKQVCVIDTFKIEDLNEKMEKTKKIILNNHFDRISHNKYSVQTGAYFTSAIAHFDSISSHLNHIAKSVNVEKAKDVLNETYKGVNTHNNTDIIIMSSKRDISNISD